MKRWGGTALLLLFPLLSFAQESDLAQESGSTQESDSAQESGSAQESQEEKIKVSFRSRGLFDATLSDYDSGALKSYYRVEDFRVGFKATYDRFEVKVDVGLGGGKVAIKDFFINYAFKNSTLTVGNAYEPFSMDMLISTYDLRFSQSASTVLAMTNSRRMGVTYHRHSPLLYFAIGAYSDNDINKLASSELKQTYAATTRLVYRPVLEADKLLHVGGALSLRTPDSEVKNLASYRTTSIGSCGVTSMFGENLLGVEVKESKLQVKSLVEFLAYYRKFLFQTEYMRSDVRRHAALPTYSAQGAYLQMCYLLKGNTYGYDDAYAIPTRPVDKGAIELAFRLNYTDLNDADSNLYGGSHSDLSLGVNYYFNPYLAVKLNGSYTFVGNHSLPYYKKDFGLVQARVQYIF